MTTAEASMQHLQFRAMGHSMLAALDPCPPRSPERLSRVPAWFATWEQRLSRYRSDGELSTINDNPGRWTRVSQVLWDVLQVALEAARWTHGRVTPAVRLSAEPGPCGRGSSDQSRCDTGAEGGLVARDDEAIQCDPATRSVRLPPGLQLDLGDVIRGWSADQAARRLGILGPALVDAGGTIAVSAPPLATRGWTVDVVDSTANQEQVALLSLRRGAVAKVRRDDGHWPRGDPRDESATCAGSDRPIRTDVVSATVIAPTACRGEVAARLALLLGSTDGLAWLEARPALAGLLVLEDGRSLHSRRLSDFLWSP